MPSIKNVKYRRTKNGKKGRNKKKSETERERFQMGFIRTLRL